MRPSRHMWHRASNPLCRFWLFYSIIFYTASDSKYIVQNKNILFPSEVILVWLEQSKKWKKSNKKFNIFRIIIIVHYHYFIILGHKGLCSVSNKTNGIKIGLQRTANSCTLSELKNCKLENPSLLFGPLAQNPGSDKRRILSPCVTYCKNSVCMPFRPLLPAVQIHRCSIRILNSRTIFEL